MSGNSTLGNGWVTYPGTTPGTSTVILTGFTYSCPPEPVSRTKLIKALAEMWANDLITYDEMKKTLESV